MPPSPPLRDAWYWVIARDRECWSDDREAELEQWLALDPRRRGELLRAAALWQAFAADDNQLSAAPFASRRAFKPDRRWFVAGGAGAAIAASFAAFIGLPSGAEQFGTSVGEVRRIPLTDGSVATINTASRIEVSMAGAERGVTLASGEAWFQVAKDPARPFIVQAGQVRIRAVGTAFSARIYADGTEVLVTEGVVEASSERGGSLRLDAGDRAMFSGSAIRRSVEKPAASDRMLAWRSGKVDFVDQPVAAAVAEFNRYNVRQLVVVDPALARERFDGIFRVNDPDAFARAVGESFDVPVDTSRAGELRIGRP